MRLFDPFVQRPEKRRSLVPATLLGALAAAVLVLFAGNAEAQSNIRFAIYKCSASYAIDYSYTDTMVGDVDFEGGRSQKLRASARYYTIYKDTGAVDLIYFDKKTLKYSRITNCPYDCFQYLDFRNSNKPKLSITNCNVQSALDINDGGSVDGERCEMFCLSGTIPRGGNKYVIPGLGGLLQSGNFFSQMPFRLKGTYCRATCYNTGFQVYVEQVLNAKDYDYAGPFIAGPDVYGVACVTGKVSCSIDKKLTLDYLNVTNNGITTVESYLMSLGYTLDVVRTWANLDQFPLYTPAQVPFLP